MIIDYPYVIMVAASVFATIGLVLLVINLLKLRRIARQDEWGQVDGTVVTSELVQTKDYDKSARIEYTYTVNGQEFHHDRVVMGSRRAPNPSLAYRYAEGEPVTVYYNPRRPTDAHLETPPAAQHTAFSVMGGLMVFSGAVYIMITVLAIQAGYPQ